MATPEPSRSAVRAVEFTVLGTTVIAIIVLALIFGGDAQTRILTTTALTLALLLVAFAYARGFERLSVANRKRRIRKAITRNPDMIRRLETLAKEAGDTFGSSAKIYSFQNGANIVNEAARRKQGQAQFAAAVPGVERIDEISQLWTYLAPHWNITNAQVSRICQGAGRKDTQSFVYALVLEGSLLKMAYWAAYRLLNTAGQIGLIPAQHERVQWAQIRDKINTVFSNFDALVRETNLAFGTDIAPFEEHITDPW